MTCIEELRKSGMAYPRTCPDCGLGPCRNSDLELEKLALVSLENARGLLRNSFYSKTRVGNLHMKNLDTMIEDLTCEIDLS